MIAKPNLHSVYLTIKFKRKYSKFKNNIGTRFTHNAFPTTVCYSCERLNQSWNCEGTYQVVASVADRQVLLVSCQCPKLPQIIY